MSKLLIAVVVASAAPSTMMVLSQSMLLSRTPFLASASSSSSESSATGQLSVNGEAIIAVTPDRATMTFQVQAKGKDKLEVQRQIDEATASLLSSLRAAGAKTTELSSKAMQLQPHYARDRHGNPLYLQVEFWEATRSVTACAHDLLQVTPWQSAARKAGAITVGEVALEASNLQDLKEEARVKAAAAARTKAQALVAALGGRLGTPINISEHASSTTDAAAYKRANSVANHVEDSVVSGDFAAGTMSVVANVAVTFQVLGDA
jgi:uncharacterized protein YggE